MSSSFEKLATVTASTKRPAVISGGKAGEPATSIASLSCTPLIPASQEILLSFSLNTQLQMFETWTQGNLDIKTGDILVVSSVEYPIRAVQSHPFKSDTRKQMIIEAPKR